MVLEWMTNDMEKYLRANYRKTYRDLSDDITEIFGTYVCPSEVGKAVKMFREEVKERNDTAIEDIRRKQIEVLENSIISELAEAQITLSKYRSKVNEAFDQLEGGVTNPKDYYTFARLEEVYNRCVIDTQKLLYDTQNKKAEIGLQLDENNKKSLIDLINDD